MARSQGQKLKLLYLKDILEKYTDEEHGLTLSEIQDCLREYEIEAERKSLYSDFEELESFGMDIEKRKVGGRTEYCLLSRDFELAEIKLLIDAVQASKFLTQKKCDELTGKLTALASEKQSSALKRQTSIATRNEAMYKGVLNSIDAIHAAICENKQICFNYCGWAIKNNNGVLSCKKAYREDKKTVSPWGLVFDNENYYLYAYDPNAQGDEMVRTYRVDKMEGVTIVDQKRETSKFPKKSVAAYARTQSSMFGGKEEKVTLRFKNDAANMLIDRFGEKNTMYPDKDPEYYNMVVNVSVSGQFISWIIGLSQKVEIVSPPYVRQEAVKMLEENMKLYK